VTVADVVVYVGASTVTSWRAPSVDASRPASDGAHAGASRDVVGGAAAVALGV
jgi:hypothetical protein